MFFNTLGPLIVVLACILSTQSIAFIVSADNSFTLNYIAYLTIGLQWIFFAQARGCSATKRTEKHFDLVGSATFVSAIIVNFVISGHYSIRTVLLNLLIIIWTVRLGAFLNARITRNNGIDARFADFKTSPSRFLMIWTLQGVWVFIMLLPLLIITQNEKNIQLESLDYIGCILFIAGILIESIADYQKLQFRSESKNKDKFIKSGLWTYSRHPNYFGEILLWCSIAVIGFSGSQSWLVFISPAFIASMLIFGSGIPILEKNADEKFGHYEEYKIYKKSTPVLVPFIGRCGDAMF
ncbi:hypothetical protein ACKWTF_015047 [Chironomus riparius]